MKSDYKHTLTTEIPYKPYACGHQARYRVYVFLFSSKKGLYTEFE